MALRDSRLRGDILEAEALLLARGAKALADCRDFGLDQFFVHRLALKRSPHGHFFRCGASLSTGS
jgi:hypothetical protein